MLLLVLPLEERKPFNVLFCTKLQAMMLLLEDTVMMPSQLFDTMLPFNVLPFESIMQIPNKLFDTTLFTILQSLISKSVIPMLVFERFRFFTVMLVQFMRITCPAF